VIEKSEMNWASNGMLCFADGRNIV